MAGAVGRPREFDLDEALEAALQMFWESGYEGVGLNQLCSRLGITKTSFYAAFGSKESLFGQVLDRYTAGPASYGFEALRQPSARSVFSALLDGAVLTSTMPGAPPGCLGVQAALPSNGKGRPAHDLLAAWRNAGTDRLEERLSQAVSEGDLPPDADPKALARYMTTVTFGIAVQAASGMERAELRGIADVALDNWDRQGEPAASGACFDPAGGSSPGSPTPRH